MHGGAPLAANRRPPRSLGFGAATAAGWSRRVRLFDPGERGLMNSLGFPEGPVAYFDYIDQWRTSGDFEGLEFR